MSNPPEGAGSRAVRPLQVAFGVNLLGNAIGVCGLPVVALAVTSEIAVAGLAVAAAVVGSTISGLLSGPVIDRVGARIAWIASTSTGSVIGALTCLLWFSGGLSSSLFIALCAVRALAEEPGRLATYGWMPELSRRSGVRLEKANAVVRSLNSAAQIVGPAVTGMVLAWWHPMATVALDAALGVLAAAVVLCCRAARAGDRSIVDPRSGPRDRPQGYRRTFRSALAVLAHDPLLISMTVAMTVFGALDISMATVGLTSYSADVLGDVSWYGTLLFGFGVGGLIGVIGFGYLGHRLPRRAAFLSGYIGVAVLSGLLAWGVPFWVALVLVLLVGVLTSPIDLIYLISLQERVPPALLNSVTGVATTIVSAPSPLLIPIVAALLAEAGPQLTFAVLAGTYLITLLLCWSLPAMRSPEQAAPAPAPPSSPPAPSPPPAPPEPATVRQPTQSKGDRR